MVTSYLPKKITLLKILLFGVSVLLLIAVQPVRGQYVEKWLAAGSFHDLISAGGGTTNSDESGAAYPGWVSDREQSVSKGLWIHARNWNSGDTETPEKIYDIKGVHIGPYATGEGEMFPVEFEHYAKFEPPKVYVGGIDIHRRDVQIDSVVPDMKADQMIYNKVNTALGLTMERWIRQFSNEYHDNYHIIEYEFTNTGNVDTDSMIELTQDLEGVRISFLDRYSMGQRGPEGTPWGRNTLNDIVGDGNKVYDSDIRASYSWLGHQPNADVSWNTLGAPYFDEYDDRDYLASAMFIGRATVHADVSATDSSDEPNQPSTTTFMDSGVELLPNPDWYPDYDTRMRREYGIVDTGHTAPYHADEVEPPPSANAPDADNPGEFDPMEWRSRLADQYNPPDYQSLEGFESVISYGPYDIPFGESITIVQVFGSDGIAWEGCYAVGKGYRQALETYGHPDADTVGINWNGKTLTKNEWVLSGRDSLMDMFAAARANYESGYNIPPPPKPPATFEVVPYCYGITLNWTIYEGESDPEQWIIGRTGGYLNPLIIPIDTLSGDARTYDNLVDNPNGPIRGINYYYFIQAVGVPISADPTGIIPTGTRLRSNRTWTQTHTIPAALSICIPPRWSQIRVVPNPYTLNATGDLLWPDHQNQIGFCRLPESCTIEIYTETGEWIRTLNHEHTRPYEEYWDLKTYAGQRVVSGIYIALITGETTGQQMMKKFVIIR